MAHDAIHAAISSPRALTHRDVQELLPAYLTARGAGQAVEKMYPDIAEHLKACPSCRATYLQLERAVETIGPFQPASIAQKRAPQPERAASFSLWHITPFRASSARPERVQILIPALFRPSAAVSSFRRDAAAPSDALLVHDTITLDKQTFRVQAWRKRTAAREFEIHVELSASRALARRVRAVLLWERKTYTRPITRRRAIFRGLPVGAPDSALTLTLELKPDERPRRNSPSRPKNTASPRARARKI